MLKGKEEAMDEVVNRLSKIEERFSNMSSSVMYVLKDAKKCKAQLARQEKEIAKLKDSHKKIYLHNLEIIKRCRVKTVNV